MITKYFSELNNMKRNHLYILLIAILILGFGIRFAPFLHKLVIGDTYYQFSIIKSILQDGSAPERLTLAAYPKGKTLSNAPLFLPYFIAYTYKILQPLGVSLTSYMVIFPAIFGSLAAIPLYLLAQELFDKRVAIITALIYVVLPASIDRTFAGFVEKESLAAITVFLWLLLFIRSARELDLARKKTLALPILSGIFMALSIYTWRGVSYFILLIALSVLIQTLLKPNEKLSQTTVLMSITGFTIIHILQLEAFSIENIFFSYRYAPLAYVSIIAAAATLPEHLNNVTYEKIQPIHMVGLFLGIFVLLILVLNLQNEIITMLNSLFNQLATGGSETAVEAQRATEQGYTLYRNPFSLMISFILVGVYYFFKHIQKNLDFNRLFVATWFLTSAFASYLQARLFFILAPVASMMIGYGFFRLFESFIGQSTSGEKEKSKSMTNLIIVVLILSIYGTISSEVGFARGLNEYQSERTDHWENAMAAVRKNTPEDSLIIAFWDYGYVIQGLGERATVADPGGGLTRRKDIAKIFTSTEDDALQIIKKYNPDDKPVYVIVSYEEFVLANTINFRADDSMYFYEHTIEKSGDPSIDEMEIDNFLDSNEIDAYAIESIGSYWRIWFTGFVPLGGEEYEPDPEMKNKLLPKLLPFSTGAGEGLEHFRLVYNDDSNFIFIYQMI
jgi:dolichyl-diphosphooligosaccharide--protein glycosyltransferase